MQHTVVVALISSIPSEQTVKPTAVKLKGHENESKKEVKLTPKCSDSAWNFFYFRVSAQVGPKMTQILSAEFSVGLYQTPSDRRNCGNAPSEPRNRRSGGKLDLSMGFYRTLRNEVAPKVQ